MKKSKIILITIILIVIIFIKIFINSPFVNISVKNTNISKDKWIEDIDYVKNKLPNLHKNLFFHTSKDKFIKNIEQLRKEVENTTISDPQYITIKLMSIISGVGDSHTSIKNFNSNIEYPIRTYWFKEGLFITETSRELQSILGCRIIKINNLPIENIIGQINSLVPHENEYMLKEKTPKLITNYHILKYFNIVKNEEATFTLEDSNGKQFHKKILASKNNNSEYISLLNIIKTKPLYMKKDDDFWYEYCEKNKLLYCQFNNCILTVPRKKDLNYISEALEKYKIEKLVIDIRNNAGGTYIDNNKLVSAVFKWKDKTKISIIVGRATFSSGLLYAIDLAKFKEISFYGEPTSGSPNHYGNIKKLTLPNSKLNITYSTKYFSHPEYKSNTFIPNYIVELSIKDYINGIDPVMDEIVKAK